MAIEILGYPSRPIKDNLDSATAVGVSASKTPAATAGDASSDHVSLTSSAALLKELEKEIAQLPAHGRSRCDRSPRRPS